MKEKIKRQILLEQTPEDVDLSSRFEKVMNAINCLLTQRERQVVEKIFTEGMSYKEASLSLDVSVATINKNVVSALKKLRSHFNRDMK